MNISTLLVKNINGDNMDYDLLLKIVLIFIGGKILLRISGRKSIAELTITDAIVTLSLGIY